MNITLILEATLLLVATFWIQAAQIELMPAFKLSKQSAIIAIAAGCGTAFSGFLIIWLGKVIKNPPKWITGLSKIVFEEVAPLFATLTPVDILLVAAASGFCEEIFFRGVLQQQLGLGLTSFLFGCFHCPSPPRHLSYGIWAFSAGLLFGWLRDWTGSLWVPIIAHALSNLIAIASLRYMVKSTSSSA
jgi:membrane protease YdiL (CAAX protease family)